MEREFDDALEEGGVDSSASAGRWLPALLVLSVCAGIFAFAYAVGERRLVTRLANEKSQLAATLSQTQSQLDALTSKPNVMSAQAPRLSSTKPSPPEETIPRRAPAAAMGVRRSRERAEGRLVAAQNPRLRKIESQLAEQQQAITNTQRDLENARTDLEGKLGSARDQLNGSIARTHDELVALENKGERNYYEFDLEKSKQFQHVGPLGISLRKTSTKHEYFDIAMLVDDRQLSKKHVNLYEPVWIYPADSHQPIEVVVNQIAKDTVHGYVSMPKYAESETSAPAGGPASTPTGTSSTNQATPERGASPTPDSLPHRPTQPL